MGLRLSIALSLFATMTGVAFCQAPEPAQSAPIERHDPTVDMASKYIGRALFLRCFCAENTLSFDDQGKPVGAIKAEDWTLAAVNVAKVERKAPGVIEMEGLRVAIRYNAERHEFERHPQNDERVKITVADTGDPKRMRAALEAMFAVGIDLPLQRAMPDYWRHYFDPRLEWVTPELSGQKIYSAVGDPAMTPPTPTHRAEPSYTAFAEHDRVRGNVVLRFVVDPQGVARDITIAQPLGYGLDERAVEAVAKFRFSPAMRSGGAVASVVSLTQEFVLVPLPR